MKKTISNLRLAVYLCAPLLIPAAGQGQSSVIVTSGTYPSTDIELRIDGTVIAKGVTGTGTLSGTDLGAGTRMLWFPDLGAFRAGGVTGSPSPWDTANLGQYSFAAGYNTKASGQYSVAAGFGALAQGSSSFAIGNNANAAGGSDIAIGSGAYANGGVAIGQGTNSTYGALALGFYTTASGTGATALGFSTNASYMSTAMGSFTVASNISTAMGYSTTAAGEYSTAMGIGTSSQPFASTVMGRYNVIEGTANTWVATEPLVIIGNGASSTATSDALVVRKNGDVGVQGVLRVYPAGDLAMSYTSGTKPFLTH